MPYQWQREAASSIHTAKQAQMVSSQQSGFSHEIQETTDEQVLLGGNVATKALEQGIREQSTLKSRSEATYIAVTNEALALEREMGLTQHLHDKFQDPLNVANLCIKLRCSMPQGEQVRDQVAQSLQEEVACPQHARRMLAQFLEVGAKELSQLEELRSALGDDVEAKTNSLEVDREALTMQAGWTPPSGAMAHSKRHPHDWRSASDNLNSQGERQCTTCSRLRQKSQAYRREFISTEQNVRDGLSKAIPVKIEETQRQMEELQQSILSVEADVRALEAQRTSVERSIEEKQNPLSLARSRLQVRRSKPEGEQIRDCAERMLEKEVLDLQFAIDRLHEEVTRLSNEIIRLTEQLQQLEQKRKDKEDALSLDQEVQRQVGELSKRMETVAELAV